MKKQILIFLVFLSIGFASCTTEGTPDKELRNVDSIQPVDSLQIISVDTTSVDTTKKL